MDKYISENNLAMVCLFCLAALCVFFRLDGAKDIIMVSIGAYAGYLKGKDGALQ
jgi:hypothetical protein